MLSPVYSPYYNPVEMLISKIKGWIRRERLNDLVKGKKRDIGYLIRESVKRVTREDCINYERHCLKLFGIKIN